MDPTQLLKESLEAESTSGVPSVTDGGAPIAPESTRDTAPTQVHQDHLLLPDQVMEAEEEVAAVVTVEEVKEAEDGAKPGVATTGINPVVMQTQLQALDLSWIPMLSLHN